MERKRGGRDDASASSGPVDPYPSTETPASILPQLPRVASLDALLREVDSLRLTLETDLSLAASAVESGHPAIAVEILDGDRGALHGFEQRALGHLHDLSAPPVTVLDVAARRRRRIPVSPFVAAAAVAGFLMGVVPQSLEPGPSDVSTSSVAAHSSLGQLQAFAAQGNTTQVRATARALHDQLRDVVANALADPDSAQQALLLLSSERDAILQSGDGALLHDVLVQSTALANRIRAALPTSIRNVVPPAQTVVVAAEPSSSPRSSASPAPKPTPAAKPSPSPTASPSASPAPKPTSSARPSPSGSGEPSSPTVLPSGQPGVPR